MCDGFFYPIHIFCAKSAKRIEIRRKIQMNLLRFVECTSPLMHPSLSTKAGRITSAGASLVVFACRVSPRASENEIIAEMQEAHMLHRTNREDPITYSTRNTQEVTFSPFC